LAENNSGLQAVLINTPPHPPWAHSHVINAKIDVVNKKITVCRYYLVWHPFSDSLLVGPTIALTGLPQDLIYEIEYWDGNKFATVGKLFVGSKNEIMKWNPNNQ